MRKITYPPSTIVKIPSLFGSSADGDVVISENTALTYTLNARNLTINAGVTLNANGRRIFVSKVLTNNGIIENSGAPAVLNVGGSGGQAGQLAGGTFGKSGRTTAGAGTSTTQYQFTYGGEGGNGGRTTTYLGGFYQGDIGSSETTPTFGNIILATIPSILAGILVGGGGASGAFETAAVGKSGGGGGGGGYLIICAKKIINTSGIIRANGGAGGNGEGTGQLAGGGGGGGGIVILFYQELTLGTEEARGGVKGVGVNGGIDGVAGTNGTVITIPALIG